MDEKSLSESDRQLIVKPGIPLGQCWCGCGRTTKLVKMTDRSRGRIAGYPMRFCHGHGNRQFHAEYSFDPKIGFGFCHCGCGEKTQIVKESSGRQGYIAGMPRLFIFGHAVRPEGPQYLVDESTGCWLWQWSVDKKGYAMINPGKTKRSGRAHRNFYEKIIGPVPAGWELDHLCRNRRCVNPAHLEPVPGVVNVRRGLLPKINEQIAAVVKFRLARGEKRWAIATSLNTTYAIVSNIATGITWRDVQPAHPDLVR